MVDPTLNLGQKPEDVRVREHYRGQRTWTNKSAGKSTLFVPAYTLACMTP